ncbi:MAG: hypothetical protein R3C59_31415 [Planctomycetaceae bacterium]
MNENSTHADVRFANSAKETSPAENGSDAIADRMERSGMRWNLEGARSMLHTRAAYQSDHLRSFLD